MVVEITLQRTLNTFVPVLIYLILQYFYTVNLIQFIHSTPENKM